MLLDGLVGAADEAFSVRDTTTAGGVHQPTTALRSGGPGSVVPWDTLGWRGAATSSARVRTANDIEKATHHPAMEPIRAYAGLASAADAEARAALAVATSSARAASSARTCSW